MRRAGTWSDSCSVVVDPATPVRAMELDVGRPTTAGTGTATETMPIAL